MKTPYIVKLKNDAPAAIRQYIGTRNEATYHAWKGHDVEIYGKVIPAYGDSYPRNQPHISVRLMKEGTAAFSTVALDEIEGEINLDTVPSKPSYSGTRTVYRRR